MMSKRLLTLFPFLACPATATTTPTPAADWDVVLVYSIDPMRVSNTPEATVKAIRTTFDRRLATLSIAQRWHVKAESPRIVVSLRGVSNLARARRLLESPGRIDFELLDDTNDPLGRLSTRPPPEISARVETAPTPIGESRVTFFVASRREILGRFIDTNSPQLPPGRAIRFGPYDADPNASLRRRPAWRTYVVERSLEKRHVAIRDADVRSDDATGFIAVSVELTRGAAVWFERLTAANIGRRLAIVIDGDVNSTPIIKTKISGGRAQISMATSASREQGLLEARDLAALLKIGALPVPVRLESETRR